MKGVPAKTTLSDDGIPSDLRPFIEVLLIGTREDYAENTPPACPPDLTERDSTS
jgi:hypothetical protein